LETHLNTTLGAFFGKNGRPYSPAERGMDVKVLQYIMGYEWGIAPVIKRFTKILKPA